MKVQLYIDPANMLSKVPYQVPNNIHYVRYQDFLDNQVQPDALTAYLYAAELAKGDIKKLKAEIEALKKPAVIGGYNISEYIRMANSETLEFDRGDMFADMTLPERIKYIVESHEKLRSEIESLKEDKRELEARLDFLENPRG
jgi:predicted RNase H-like nuclease (RuvC/YqgF family)